LRKSIGTGFSFYLYFEPNNGEGYGANKAVLKFGEIL
jgi:hypothetical protein